MNLWMTRALGSLALAAAAGAQAQHLDVKVSTHAGPVAGSRIELDVYGDLQWYLSQAGGLPRHYASGHNIFPSNFSDRKGGPYLTDNPGFQSFRAQFAPGEALWFGAFGRLEYLAPGSTDWGVAPSGGGVRLYGAIPDDVVFDYVVNGTRESEYLFYANGTLFHGDGIAGPGTAPIGLARNDGSLHYHLNWSLEGATQAVRGSYLAELRVFSPATEGGAQKYVPSDPFYVMFRNDVTDDEYAQALRTLIVTPQSADPPRPSPFMRVWNAMQGEASATLPAVALFTVEAEDLFAPSLAFAAAPGGFRSLPQAPSLVSAVPEPGALELGAAGIAVLWSLVRYRRSKGRTEADVQAPPGLRREAA